MRMVRVTTVFLGVLLALGSACSSDDDNQPSAKGTESAPGQTEAAFARLDPAAFADRMEQNQDAAVINVHIPYEGEIDQTDAFIPYDKIVGDSRLPQDKSSEILLYCRSGNMSEESGAALTQAGYTNVAHLEGGMKAWKAAGRQLTHDPAHASETPAGQHS